ncbi:MAG TPA: hypothetical protein VJM50_00260 [Pyrinomonadaceae bacterium]|nr:hypothetical protein [Pyrinomonadaceae bacterium]
MKQKELIERDAEGLMQEAASDELFLADLNETMEDFGHTDREDHEFLTVDRLAGLPRSDSWSEQGKTRLVHHQ